MIKDMKPMSKIYPNPCSSSFMALRHVNRYSKYTEWMRVLREKWDEFRRNTQIRPKSGSFLLDIFFLLSIAAVQLNLIPSLFSWNIVIDLMTPWLVVTCVYHSRVQAIFLCMLGAFVLETHGTQPAGFYLCSYWVIVSILFTLRNYLYWQHMMPWTFVFFVAQLWIFILEIAFVTLRGVAAEMKTFEVGLQLLKMMCSCLFGIFLIKVQFARERTLIPDSGNI